MKKSGSLKKSLAVALIFAMSVILIPASNTDAAKRPKLNKKKATVCVGKTVRLKVKNIKDKGKIKWKSSRKKVATVSKKGLVKGRKAGKAIITAKAGNKKLKCKITVKKRTSERPAGVPENPLFTSGDWHYWKNADGTLCIAGYEGNDSTVDVPGEIDGQTVTSIGTYAFAYRDSVTSIILPESLTLIGNYAFSYCGSVTVVTIREGVVTIGEKAFYSCKSLKDITIPEGVQSIGSEAFAFCTSLKNVTLPESINSIGSGAFMECENLNGITIPNNVSSIGDFAFSGCRFRAEQFVNLSTLDEKKNNYWGTTVY